MGRRRGRRWVYQTPRNLYFTNQPLKAENTVILTIAEFEAMRLRHCAGLNQKASAEKMGVSQPTLSRILESAHRKNTLALLEGKIIKVYGGNFDYKVKFVGYGCLDCNHEWKDADATKNRKVKCVNCNSENVFYLVKEHM